MGSTSTLLRQCLALALLTSALTWAAPAEAKPWTAATGAIALAFFTVISLLRHRRVQQLTAQIDEVLHSGRTVRFEKCREGDVAVLANELEKMVARLARATDALQKERGALADSLADVSHQIRTPLTAAQLMLAAIEQEDDPRRRKHQLRQLESQMERISWLVTTLLKIAKVDAGAIRVQANPVNVAQCMRRAASPLETALDLRDVALETDIPLDAAFTGDELWTAEAIENILKNCMEKTPAGGHIRVSACETPLATTVRITDTGPGIAPADLPRIFDRFYRGDEGQPAPSSSEDSAVRLSAAAPEGFGIGLSLAQALISAQGGTLQAANGGHGGAEFTLTFPKLVV